MRSIILMLSLSLILVSCQTEIAKDYRDVTVDDLFRKISPENREHDKDYVKPKAFFEDVVIIVSQASVLSVEKSTGDIIEHNTKQVEAFDIDWSVPGAVDVTIIGPIDIVEEWTTQLLTNVKSNMKGRGAKGLTDIPKYVKQLSTGFKMQRSDVKSNQGRVRVNIRWDRSIDSIQSGDYSEDIELPTLLLHAIENTPTEVVLRPISNTSGIRNAVQEYKANLYRKQLVFEGMFHYEQKPMRRIVVAERNVDGELLVYRLNEKDIPWMVRKDTQAFSRFPVFIIRPYGIIDNRWTTYIDEHKVLAGELPTYCTVIRQDELDAQKVDAHKVSVDAQKVSG